MPDADFINLVRDDTLACLGPLFEPVGDGFAFCEGLPELIGTEPVAAVPWQYTGRHTGDFQGVFPTGRPVVISGVTIVDDRNGEALFARYIDWASVFTQLGMTVSTRVLVDEDEYAFGRETLRSRSRDPDNA